MFRLRTATNHECDDLEDVAYGLTMLILEGRSSISTKSNDNLNEKNNYANLKHLNNSNNSMNSAVKLNLIKEGNHAKQMHDLIMSKVYEASCRSMNGENYADEMDDEDELEEEESVNYDVESAHHHYHHPKQVIIKSSSSSSATKIPSTTEMSQYSCFKNKLTSYARTNSNDSQTQLNYRHQQHKCTNNNYKVCFRSFLLIILFKKYFPFQRFRLGFVKTFLSIFFLFQCQKYLFFSIILL